MAKKKLLKTFTFCALALTAITGCKSSHQHAYGNPTYTWMGKTCIASRACVDCGEKETEEKVGTYIKDTDSTCEINEKGHYYVEFTNTAFTPQGTAKESVEKEGSAKGHQYGTPTYVWNDKQCSAEATCIRTGCTHKENETVTGTYVKDFDATCKDNEKGHYHANFTSSAFTSQDTATGSVEIPDTKGKHHYTEPNYVWNKEKCTASHSCTACQHEETEESTGTYVKDTDASCTDNEKGHYHAEFTNTAFATQNTAKDSVVKEGTAKGHKYGTPTYVWNDDKCTASHTCSACQHKETEEVTASYVKDTDATCTANEKGHYKAEFTNTAFTTQNTEKDSVEKKGSAKGHKYGTSTYVWNDDKCTASHTCSACQHEETEEVTASYVKDTDATCTANEKGHYKAEFTKDGFTTQNTAKDSVEKKDTAGCIYELKERLDAFRDETGLESHYECSRCHKLYDLEKKETTKEALNIPHRHFTYETSETSTDIKLVDFGKDYSLNQHLALFDVKFDSTKYSELGFKLHAQSTKGDTYFGNYWVLSNTGKDLTKDGKLEEQYEGLSLVKMTDGYYRVYADLSKLSKKTGSGEIEQIRSIEFMHPNTSTNRGNGAIEVLPTRGDVIYVDKDIKLTKEQSGEALSTTVDFNFKQCYVAKKLKVDFTFTEENATKVRFMLFGASNWKDCYGYWGFNKDGTMYEKADDPGVSSEVLEADKSIRITIDFSKVITKEGSVDPITRMLFRFGDINIGHVKVYGETTNFVHSESNI